ncbi:LysR family transcriptional regulator [Proteus mirabilis]|uniref:LysR family transcriptional regulator n=1 Tax=Proteus mirabilis TaxID=584 RepID=UPI0034DD4EDB
MLLWLSDTGHFGEASKQLCISQPALTKQIKTLESQLDIVLFERGRHGAKLTQEGQYLLNQAQVVLRESQYSRKTSSSIS